jgi:acetyltransferase EpsM
MEASTLYIAGTGSFSAEIGSWATASGAAVAGLIELEDAARVGSMIHGFPIVTLEPPPDPEHPRAVLGVGGDRKAMSDLLAGAGWSAAGIVHPSAQVAPSARVAATATVGPLAVVGAETAIGDQVILSRGVLVGHHVRIGDFATLNPGVNVGGSSAIGEGAFLGMGCVIANGIEVGDAATVAAGAVTLRPVPPRTRVQGVPAIPYSSR